ncbi:MAG: FtsW/RodA/SpoVE family cell cycle protein [Oscillospiraceae bacterium]
MRLHEYIRFETSCAPDRAAAGAKRGSFDLPFFVLTLLLLAIGVIMVLSSSFARALCAGQVADVLFRPGSSAVAGVVGMILRFPPCAAATYRRWSLAPLGVSIFLLAIVWIPHIGVVGGASRWLSLGFTTFQPSEIAKIAVVLFFSSMICTYKDQMQTIRYGVVPFMVITGGIVILLMLEPHLSASIIIMALAIVMDVVGGIKLSYLLIGMGGAGALLLIR